MEQRTIEDYCRIILKLDKGEGVRALDIRKGLNLSKITVSLTLQKLTHENYIKMKKIRQSKTSTERNCNCRENEF